MHPSNKGRDLGGVSGVGALVPLHQCGGGGRCQAQSSGLPIDAVGGKERTEE